MTYFAFTARHETKAATELREAGYDAFCLMKAEYAAASSHVRKKSKWVVHKRVAISRLVIGRPLNGTLDLWKLRACKHITGVIGIDGRPCAIREAELAHWIKPKLPLFRDDQEPDIIARKGIAAPKPNVRVGDVVKFELACQVVEGPVQVVNGDRLLVALGLPMMGVENIMVPIDMIQVA